MAIGQETIYYNSLLLVLQKMYSMKEYKELAILLEYMILTQKSWNDSRELKYKDILNDNLNSSFLKKVKHIMIKEGKSSTDFIFITRQNTFMTVQRVNIILKKFGFINIDGSFYKGLSTKSFSKHAIQEAVKLRYKRQHEKRTVDNNIQYVYILASINFNHDICYKIGISYDAMYRAKTLSHTDTEIRIIATLKEKRQNALAIEKKLHKMFKDKQLNGEWFSLNEEDFNVILKMYNWNYNSVLHKNILQRKNNFLIFRIKYFLRNFF